MNTRSFYETSAPAVPAIYRPLKVQKKIWRKMTGLLRSKRCPACRHYTRQVRVTPPEGGPFRNALTDIARRMAGLPEAKIARRCLSCSHEWLESPPPAAK
jgi:hypothetical protein